MAENTPNLSTISNIPQEGIAAAGQLQNTLTTQAQIAQEANRAAGAQALGYAEIASREKQFAQDQQGVNRRFDRELTQSGQQFEQGLEQQAENQKRQREMMAWQQKQAQVHDLQMRQFDASEFDRQQEIEDQLALVGEEKDRAVAQGAVEVSEEIERRRQALLKERDALLKRMAKAQVMNAFFQPGGGADAKTLREYVGTLDLHDKERWNGIGTSINSYFSLPEAERGAARSTLVNDFVMKSVDDPVKRAGAIQFLNNLMAQGERLEKPVPSFMQTESPGLLGRMFGPENGLPEDVNAAMAGPQGGGGTPVDMKAMVEQAGQFGLSKGDVSIFLDQLYAQASAPGAPVPVADPETGEVRAFTTGGTKGGEETKRLGKLKESWERVAGPAPAIGGTTEVVEEVVKQLSQGYLDDEVLRKMMDGLPLRKRDAILKWGQEAMKRVEEVRDPFRQGLMESGSTSQEDLDLDRVLFAPDLKGGTGGYVEKAKEGEQEITRELASLNAPETAQARAAKKYLEGPGKGIAEKRKGILRSRPKRVAPQIPGYEDYKE